MQPLKKIRIALIGALSDEKFSSKVEALIDLDAVEKVYLFRHVGNPINAKYSYKIVYKKSRLPKPLFFIKSLISIFFLGLSNKIDFIVGVYFFPYGIIGSIAGLFCKIPVINILPGSDLNLIVKKKRFLGLLKKSYKIAARGNNSIKSLKNLGVQDKKLFVLQNTFELPKNSNGNFEKKWDIVFVGYIRKQKRIDLTVEVIEKLRENFPGISCVIVGDGPEYANIRNLISSKGLSDTILMVGYQKNIEEYLNRSGIFLLTSESEGLPMALIEALSYGLPVVTSDINDISDLIIEGKNGFLIPSLSLDDYVSALSKILNDQAVYNDLCHNAKITINEFHKNTSTFAAVQNTWQKILEV